MLESMTAHDVAKVAKFPPCRRHVFLGLAWLLICFAGFQSPVVQAQDLKISSYGGSTSNSDNSTAFNSALTACKAGTGSTIVFDKGNYTFTQGVTIDGAGCSVRGAGQRATNLIFNASSGNFITMAEYGNTVSDLGFFSAISSGSRVWTSGYALAVGGNGNGASYGIFKDLYFEGVPGAVHVYNSSETRFENLYIVNPTGSAAVKCDDGGISKPVYATRMHNVAIGYSGANNTTTNGFFLDDGCYTPTVSASSVSGGTSTTNPSGAYCLLVQGDATFVVLTDFECDHSLYGAVFDGGNMIQSVNGFFGSTLANNGITFTSNFTGNAQFTNNDIRGNWYHGVLLGGGTDIVFTGNVIGNNSQASTGSYNGIVVGSGINLFTLTGNRSGAINQGSGTPSATQGYGICVNAGSSTNYVITNNNLTGNTIGGLGDGGTGTKVVANNLN